jgi:hypothetical protein
MITTAIPTAQDLRAAPELAALAVLDAALVTAEEMLLAYHPAVDDLVGTFQGHTPPLRCAIAAILVARFVELHELVGWYRLVNKPSRDSAADDFPF